MLHIREQAEASGRATFSAMPSSSGAKTAPSNWGTEAGLTLGSGRRGQCATAIPRNPPHLALSEGRNETHRLLISLGYARLKPNPVGQQRLHSTIFPFGPKNKAKKSCS
jgi:hypothetical protein